MSTLGDDLAYEIGRDSFGNPLSDGTTFNVPKGVTVMIDAGAIIKLHGANINAGTYTQGLNLSNGAIQILGTPQQSVILTSDNNSRSASTRIRCTPRPRPGTGAALFSRTIRTSSKMASS